MTSIGSEAISHFRFWGTAVSMGSDNIQISKQVSTRTKGATVWMHTTSIDYICLKFTFMGVLVHQRYTKSRSLCLLLWYNFLKCSCVQVATWAAIKWGDCTLQEAKQCYLSFWMGTLHWKTVEMFFLVKLILKNSFCLRNKFEQLLIFWVFSRGVPGSVNM